MHTIRLLLLIVILLAGRCIQAQEWSKPETRPFEETPGFASTPPSGQANSSVSPLKITLIGMGTVTAATYVTMVKWDRWLEKEFSRFHFQNDWNTALWADKLGHAYITGVAAQAYTDAFRWSGMTDRQAEWWGSGTALLIMTYKEVLDGFATNWGFSPGDQLFNTIGTGLPLLRSYVPALQHIHLKAGYWPTNTPVTTISNDYTGQSYWLTFNIHGLSGGAVSFPPAWLNIAAGYKTRDPDPFSHRPTAYELYIGLDIELSGLPIDHPVWNGLTRWLRFIHLPAPAIRLTPVPGLVFLGY